MKQTITLNVKRPPGHRGPLSPDCQVLEFDQPGAAVTEALAQAGEGVRTLDEIILQRCKEGLWDDVVRKAALRPGEFKPK